ncbi:hypothetical protein RUM43_007115, partial [Polyplax serrata]
VVATQKGNFSTPNEADNKSKSLNLKALAQSVRHTCVFPITKQVFPAREEKINQCPVQ